MKIYNINYLGIHGGAAAVDRNSGEEIKEILKILGLEEESEIYEFNKFSTIDWFYKLRELNDKQYNKLFFRVSKVLKNYTDEKIKEFMTSNLKKAFDDKEIKDILKILELELQTYYTKAKS